jgi:transposase-like protein
MKRDYQIVDRNDNTRQLAKFLAENGQVLMPMVELIETAQLSVHQLMTRLGRATLEAVLEISAAGVAGENHQGKAGGEIVRHGRQSGTVALKDRKVQVDRPRLRKREGGAGAEVSIPAYAAMKSDESLGDQVLNVMMRGVSTRNYKEILTDACDCVGVSRSSISREFVEASEQSYKDLLERKFDDLDLLILYIDGIVIGGHSVLVCIGVDSAGYKHVLGMKEGASENATVVKALLTDLVERGVKSGVRRLFVIDGSKALRAGIDAVYGSDNPIQRCRLHKERNVLDYLPDEQKEYARLSLRAAFSLVAAEGEKRLQTLAQQYEKEYPSAAGSIREGLSEMFTVNRLGVPASVRRSLVSTNIIESPNAGVRMRTRRVTKWESGSMVLRWAAASFLSAEQSFRRLSGYKDLWMLSAALGRNDAKNQVLEEENCAIAA